MSPFLPPHRHSSAPVVHGSRRAWSGLFAAASLALSLFGASEARGSTAYGSINNFDVVNDTGHPCHGFEIELEDLQTTEITYTFDWNHYGKSRIASGTTAGGKPATSVRWEAVRNANGTWSAFTAIPTAPLAPTDGHQFTNPNVNFGGEHFGTGYTRNPTAVRYFWLLDDGAGALVRGPEVQISTPVFNYAPAVGAVAAQVQAVIVPPVPEAPPPKEFGDPMWVKEIRTTTHNANKVPLRDLVSDDPNDPNDKNWRNGEPDEVETEWQLMQTDFNKADGGANGELAAAPEKLNHGDEVVTRRYEFFKYSGPIDNETNEAMADSVAADGRHGRGVKSINGVDVDLATVEIVGDYIGAQMAGFDAQGEIGLIDQVPDGEIGAEYPARTVIVPGANPFTATTQGKLPQGMNFDLITGVLSGTPSQAGSFSLTVNATDGVAPAKTKTYSFIIADAGVPPPPLLLVATSASPAGGGTTTGDGSYLAGASATVTATASAGFRFVNWTDNGVGVSSSASFDFLVNVNRSLVANFVAVQAITTAAAPANLGSTSGGGTFDAGTSVTVSAAAGAGAVFVNWTESGAEVSTAASYTFTATANRSLVAHFAAAPVVIGAVAVPANGGAVSGAGTVASGTAVTLNAAPNPGFTFVSWTENGTLVSATPSYSFAAVGDRTLVANFQPATMPVFTGGTFQGIIGSLPSATPTTCGLATLTTVPGTRTVSALLLLGEARFSFRAGVDLAGAAQISLRRRGASALLVDLHFDEVNGFTGTIVDDTVTMPFAARPCPYSSTKPLADWPGDYTHIIGFPRPRREPLPVAAGTHTISARGAVRLAGKLSDGTAYSVASLVTDTQHFALYDATKLPGQAGFILGDIALANADSILLGSPVTWKPATPQAAGRFQFYFDHYARPARGESVLPVAPGVHNLDVIATNPIGGVLGGWQLILRPNGTTTDLRLGPGAMSLRVDLSDGGFSGKLNDGAATRPFSGVVWQSTGTGFGIIPGLADAVSLRLETISTAP